MKRTISVMVAATTALLLSACSASFGESGTVTVTEYVSAEDSATSGASTEATPALNDEGIGGSDSAAAESATESSGADAFHFESGTLEIGPFDPDDVYPNVFDPCKEISAEEFAERGFKTDGQTFSRGGGSLLTCSLLQSGDQQQVSLNLAGNLITENELASRGYYIGPVESHVFTSIFEYTTDNPTDKTCRLGIETKRGQVQVTINAVQDDLPKTALCQFGLQFLESFAH